MANSFPTLMVAVSPPPSDCLMRPLEFPYGEGRLYSRRWILNNQLSPYPLQVGKFSSMGQTCRHLLVSDRRGARWLAGARRAFLQKDRSGDAGRGRRFKDASCERGICFWPAFSPPSLETGAALRSSRWRGKSAIESWNGSKVTEWNGSTFLRIVNSKISTLPSAASLCHI